MDPGARRVMWTRRLHRAAYRSASSRLRGGQGWCHHPDVCCQAASFSFKVLFGQQEGRRDDSFRVVGTCVIGMEGVVGVGMGESGR